MKNALRFIGIILILILLALSVLVSCAQAPSSPATTPAAKPASTPAPTQVKIWNLKFTTQDPESSHSSQNCSWPWIKQVEQVTQNRVKITPYFAETLVKGADTWNALKSGVADIGWMWQGAWPGLTPLADAANLPFIGIVDGATGSYVNWKLYEKFPEVQKEFAEIHPLLFFNSGTYVILSKKQIKSLDDFKGVKVRAAGQIAADLIKRLGGTPVSLGAPDLYDSLQKGIIDGAAVNWSLVMSFNLDELAKYYLIAPFFATYFSVSMNNNVWNSLTPDIQKALEDAGLIGFKGSMLWGERQLGFSEFEQWLKKRGRDYAFYSPPSEEVAKWTNSAAKPIWSEWVAKTAGPSQKVLDEAIRLAQEYKK